MGNLEKTDISMRRKLKMLKLAKRAWPLAFISDFSLIRRHQKYLIFLILRLWLLIGAIFLITQISHRHLVQSIFDLFIFLGDLIVFYRLRKLSKKNALVLLLMSSFSTLLIF